MESKIPKFRRHTTELIWGRFSERFSKYKKWFRTDPLTPRANPVQPKSQSLWRHNHAHTERFNREAASGAPDFCPTVSTEQNHTLVLLLFQEHNHWSAKDLIKWHMQDMTWCFPLRSSGHCATTPVLPEEIGNIYDDYFAPVVLLLCRLEVSQEVFFTHFSCASARTASTAHPGQFFQSHRYIPWENFHSYSHTRKIESKRWLHGLSWGFKESHPTRLVV